MGSLSDTIVTCRVCVGVSLQHHTKASKCSTHIPVHGIEGILHNYRKYRKSYPIASFSRHDCRCFVIYTVNYSMSGSLNLFCPHHKTRPLHHYGVRGGIKTVCGFCGVFPRLRTHNHLLNHQPPSNPHHSTHLSEHDCDSKSTQKILFKTRLDST